ncbi:unnamed protein product [Mesocestoides corti]|uniref:Uncharacterized protein n=1 Tax=Mesocestoides corti TaxID=53468 RepID=A0A0R3UIL4_MESCO|nr:unnamed protein product [Mesocestoides corti]
MERFKKRISGVAASENKVDFVTCEGAIRAPVAILPGEGDVVTSPPLWSPRDVPAFSVLSKGHPKLGVTTASFRGSPMTSTWQLHANALPHLAEVRDDSPQSPAFPNGEEQEKGKSTQASPISLLPRSDWTEKSSKGHVEEFGFRDTSLEKSSFHLTVHVKIRVDFDGAPRRARGHTARPPTRPASKGESTVRLGRWGTAKRHNRHPTHLRTTHR